MAEKSPKPSLSEGIMHALIDEGFPPEKLVPNPSHWTKGMKNAVVETVAKLWETGVPNVRHQILDFFIITEAEFKAWQEGRVELKDIKKRPR
ncbi:MAG: hypothetical protein Q7R74_01270 [bacterium]|nr:hypothetical protein [bacterium]